MRFWGRTDLSFQGDDVGRFLPWIIAFMVLLASFAIAGAFALNGVAEGWDRGVANTMTVQLRAEPDEGRARRLQSDTIKALQKVRGVVSVRTISAAEVRRQLEPWLGAAANSAALPLPQVLEIRVDRERGATREKLKRAIEPVAESATVDDHRAWVDDILRAIRSAEILALIVVLLIGGATMGTVIFTTRAGLGLQREAIAVLHLVGAQDAYVAHQFARRAMVLGLRGSLIGLALAAPSLVAFDFLLEQLKIGLLPELSLGVSGWISILLLVPLVAGVAMMTARRTVLKTLTNIV